MRDDATVRLRGRVGGRLLRRRNCGPGQGGDMELVKLLLTRGLPSGAASRRGDVGRCG